MTPRNMNVFVEGIAADVPSPAIDELQALASVDIALPEEVDFEALQRAEHLFEARSFADDLRLPPPPRRARTGVELQHRIASSVATFQAKNCVAVAVEPSALEAEARLMAACEGISRFQDQIQAARQRPTNAIEQRIALKRY